MKAILGHPKKILAVLVAMALAAVATGLISVQQMLTLGAGAFVLGNIIIDVQTEITAFVLAAAASNTSTLTGSAVLISGYRGVLKIILNSSAATAGTNPTLDVKVQHSVDGSTGWADTGSAFTQVTTVAGLQTLGIDTRALHAYIRIIGTIGGTASPAFTYGVEGVGQLK